MKDLQDILDLFAKKNNLNCRYILRNFSVDLNGFGGLKNYTLELYRKDWKGSTLLATVFSKGKSDEVEKLAAAELLTRIVKGNLLNYGLE